MAKKENFYIDTSSKCFKKYELAKLKEV